MTTENNGVKQTDIGTIPVEWEVASVAQKYSFTKKPRELKFAEYVSIPFVPMDLVPTGKLNFLDFISKKPTEFSSGTYFEAGDLLLAKITPSFENGKQGIIPQLPNGFGVATTEVIPIKEISETSDIRFLAYYLLRDDIRSSLAGKMEGSTGRQRLSPNVVANIQIAFPPLTEQRTIAAILSKIQQAIEVQEKIIERTKELKKSLMAKLFTEGLHGEELKETEIGSMPKSWEVATLGTLNEFLQYGTSVRCEYDTKGMPVLRIPNVINGEVNLDDLKYANLPQKVAEKLMLSNGDLLFVRTNGRREYVGRCAVFKDEIKNALFASYMIRARLKKNLCQPEYLQYYAETDRGRAWLSGQASSASDGKYNINTQTLRAVVVPLPSIAEQGEIVKTLSMIGSKISNSEQKKNRIQALFKSMLHQLMTGTIRVKNIEIPESIA